MGLFKNRKKNKQIHDHLRLIAVINTGIAVVSLIAVLVLFARFRTDSEAEVVVQAPEAPEKTVVSERPSIDAPTQEEIAQRYREDVNTLLAGYDFTDSATAEQLSYGALELFAPNELKNMHLQIVVSLQDAQQGKSKAARKRIEQLRTQHEWLLPDYK